jgi:pyruvate ferredoxin oxidoreductase gamma subunit
MNAIFEITWYGRGGQGVITAGKLLAEAAMEAGFYFQAAPEYGPERAGAPIKAYTRISDRPIWLHSSVEEPDAVVVLDPTLMSTVDITAGLKPGGTAIINSPKAPSWVRQRLGMEFARIVTVAATRIAIDELGRDITNTPLLGALVAATGILDVGDVIAQTRARFRKKMSVTMVDANLRAICRGAREIQDEGAETG